MPRVSRLQKLLNLLENGTSEATRKAAAKQIADIAKVHPEQLPSILRKVSAHLYHKTWETRVAAGEAIGLLADHFAHISVRDLAAQCHQGSSNTQAGSYAVSLTFKSFNLQHVLEKGSALLASGGQEFDIADDPSITPKQRIEKMRQQLKKRLGLDRGMEGIMDTDELLQDDDLDVVVDRSKQQAASANKQQASELLQNMEGLSARERNKLKRKAKALGRTDSARPVDSRLQPAAGTGAAEPSSSQKASEDASCEQDEEEWRAILAGAWPFQRLCDQLCVDILDPCWEVRHGAAVALREVLRSHAASAAVQAPLSDQTQGWCSPGGKGKRPMDAVSSELLQAAQEANAAWLEDCLVLLLCVLALDRFGDYGSDQVTAPVRETAAQALGMALQPMDVATVQCVVQLMQQLMEQPLWDVRCGGYLGLKYTLAGRQDMGKQLLQDSLPSLLAGLQDSDDDVRAASADALVPLAPVLFQLGPGAVRSVRSLLWELLVQLEELSPATMSVMALLAQLYGSGAAAGAGAAAGGEEQGAGAAAGVAESVVGTVGTEDELGSLVPRLWLFLRHSISGVRLSTVQCLERLLLALQQQMATDAAAGTPVATWLQPVLTALLLLTFQNLLVESDERVLACTMRVWQLLLACSTAAELIASNPDKLLNTLLGLASTPTGSSYDVSCMYGPHLDADSGSISMMSLSDLAAREAAAAEAKDKAARAAAAAASAPRKRARKGASTDAAGPNPSAGAMGAAAARRAELTVGAGGEASAVRMRLMAAEALGHLVQKLHGQDTGVLLGEIMSGLQSMSAYQRHMAALVLWYWRGISQEQQQQQQQQQQQAADPQSEAATLALLHQLLCCSGPSQPHPPPCAEPYSEVVPFYAQMRREALALGSACLLLGHVVLTPGGMAIDTVNADQALAVLSSLPAEFASAPSVAPAAQRLRSNANTIQNYEVALNQQAVASCAAAAVRGGPLPAKLNQVILPLMGALRKETESAMQALYGAGLAELMVVCTTRTPCPNDKLIRNICTQACSDASETPNAAQAAEQARQQQQLEERQQSHRAAGPRAAAGAAGGASGSAASQAAGAIEAAAAAGVATDAVHNPARNGRLGAEAALKAIAARFGPRLWEQLPGLWALISGPITAAAAVLDPSATQPQAAATPAATGPGDVQLLVNALQILKVTAPHVSRELLPSLASLLPALVACSRHDNAVVRAGCAKCLASLTTAWLDELMPPLLRLLVPLLGSADEATRLGSVEASAALVASLGFRLVSYATLLVVPLLRRMSDASEAVRRCATACFGALVALLPLAQGMPAPSGLDEEQLSCMAHDTALVSQLLDNRQVEDFSIPPCLELPVTLRPYQQEGINWLAFLRRFGLHGVLADDMGLGKTLQASCIMGAAAAEEWEAYGRAMSGVSGPAAAAAPPWPRPCLVVCPSTLVAHWCHEVKRYVSPKALRPVQYQGTPGERTRQQAVLAPALLPPGTFGALPSPYAPDGTTLLAPQYNLVVMSYETLRADVDWVATIPWLYCVLDEGHMIKSPKARITLAAKRVPAAHRLLLSGTPIQNNVLELWSLFDFLMPGFLGTERDFNAKYGKAVQAARYSKRGSRELEAGLLAVEALHKQVMPFVLRRTKAQVLQDLPPKIIQDIFCDMSPLQMRLYEDFQQSSASKDVVATISQQREAVDEAGGGGGQVLKALQYLRKLCSHPELVLDWKVPEHRQAVLETLGLTDASEAAGALKDVEVAPKLAALRDLLAQCGVISMPGSEDGPSNTDADEGSGGAGHRLLVFAQMKGMLDLVERDVLVPSGVSFMRIDGSVEPNARFSVVQRFNSDPTIDVLLLTTSVGGLGLNLTSADTVVFLEHDWNPSKDLQAMDRAHRLGQTRTVNVYRLLMRNTIEEKVMSLQQFKTDVANAVVNQDNISLKEMDTTQLLDLFGTSGQAQGAAGAGAAAGDVAAAAKKQSGLQALLSSLGDLWDESQYTNEFSMDAFMSKVGNAKTG